MLYEKVDTNLNFVDREKKVLQFWKDKDIAQKAIDQRQGNDTFTFYDGPPTANGKPHIGHVLTRVIKDMLPRYQSMKGKNVLRKAGWDTHGLPVELEVEKSIGINGKDQIEKYGIEPFIKKCRESVWKYKAMWEEFSDVVGFWAEFLTKDCSTRGIASCRTAHAAGRRSRRTRSRRATRMSRSAPRS